MSDIGMGPDGLMIDPINNKLYVINCRDDIRLTRSVCAI